VETWLPVICVDPEDENFFIGRQTEKDAFFQNVIWRILPCTLPAGCATAEELAKVTFTPIVPKPIQDLANKKSPIRYVTIADEVHYLSTAFTSRQTYNVLKAEVWDEDGFLFGKKLAKSYSFISSVGLTTSDRNAAQLSCTANDIELGNCKPYFLLTFQTSPQKMVIERKYKGMVETFSELGGMVDMLFMLFFFPYCIYNARVFKEQLVEEVFGMQKPSNRKIKSDTNTGSLRVESIAQTDSATKESYKAVYEKVEDCLDIAHIYRELLQLKQLLNGRIAPDSKDSTFKIGSSQPPTKPQSKADSGRRISIQQGDEWQASGHLAQTVKHKNSITHQKKIPVPRQDYQSLVDARDALADRSKPDLQPPRLESDIRPDSSEAWHQAPRADATPQAFRGSSRQA